MKNVFGESWSSMFSKLYLNVEEDLGLGISAGKLASERLRPK